MSWTKKLFFLTIGITVPLIIIILVLELIFGLWLDEDEWSKTRDINVILDIQLDYKTKNIDSKDSFLVRYTRDKNGLRGSCVNAKDIDVLTLGGSTTDQRYISDGKTYQDVLQTLLSKRYGRKICVSNAGIDGHSTYGHLESFKIWFPLIEGLRPKYFLFYVGINDAGFRAAPNSVFDISNRSGETEILGLLRRKSVIYDSLRNLRNILSAMSHEHAYAAHFGTPPAETEYIVATKTGLVDSLIAKNTESFEKRFLELLLRVRSYGAKPICVSQPHLFSRNINGVRRGVKAVFEYKGIMYNGLDYDTSINELTKSMMRLCLENGGFFIDVASKKFEDGDFYDSVHLTQAGAKRLGDYMYEEFVRQKILF